MHSYKCQLGMLQLAASRRSSVEFWEGSTVRLDWSGLRVEHVTVRKEGSFRVERAVSVLS